MKTLLVPLDGSLTAEQVLPYVRLLAPILSGAFICCASSPKRDTSQRCWTPSLNRWDDLAMGIACLMRSLCNSDMLSRTLSLMR